MYFFWVYNQKLKTPRDGTCLGEPLGGFVILCIFIYFHLSMIFILLFYLHLISRLLCHVTGTPPWLLRPMKASTSSELYPDYFWLPFLFHLPRVLRFWVGIFYPQAFFTLHSFMTFWHIPDILAQPAFIKVSLGAGSYFLESCRASYWSLKHRPGPSVCLIHSNPQSFIHLKFVFIHVNIANVLLVVKALLKKYRSAAINFE